MAAKSVYSSNITKLRDNIYIGKAPSTKNEQPYVNDLKFLEIIEVAKLKYIGSDIGISTYDLSIEFNISSKKAEYLYSLLRQCGCRRKAPVNYSVTFSQQDIINTTILDTEFSIKQRLENIRTVYDEEIKIHGEQTLIAEGFVYLISNLAFPGWVKAGMTIDYENRLSQYNIYDPTCGFKMHIVKWSSNRRGKEQELLNHLSDKSLSRKGEWFKIDIKEAESIFDKV